MANDLSALNAQSGKPQIAAKVQTTFLQKFFCVSSITIHKNILILITAFFV